MLKKFITIPNVNYMHIIYIYFSVQRTNSVSILKFTSYQNTKNSPNLNASSLQGELSPHPNRMEVSLGKNRQLVFKMSPCLLDTPIAVTTWQRE